MSKSKFYAGRALIVGAIVSFVSFLILWAKHKSLAKAFLACSATSAVAGGVLIHAHKKEEEAALESLYECSEEFEEILENADEAEEADKTEDEITTAEAEQTEDPAKQAEADVPSQEAAEPTAVPVDETATETEFAQ